MIQAHRNTRSRAYINSSTTTNRSSDPLTHQPIPHFNTTYAEYNALYSNQKEISTPLNTVRRMSSL